MPNQYQSDFMKCLKNNLTNYLTRKTFLKNLSKKSKDSSFPDTLFPRE